MPLLGNHPPWPISASQNTTGHAAVGASIDH
jgi:hypothetical protein